MKVLLITSSNSRNAGGLYPMVKSLGNALLKIKDIEPIALGFRDEYSEEDILTYKPLKLVEYHIIGPPGVGLTFDLLPFIKKLRPDVIHMNGIWMLTSYLNQKYSTKNKIPYLISPHGMLDKWILNCNPRKKKLGLFLYENKHLRNAACIQALSSTEYDSIRQLGFKNPIAIIPNGVFLPDTDKINRSVKPLWKTGDDRKVLLFLGRIHQKKGLDNLIKAWAGLGNFKKYWKLIVAGESKNLEYYESLLQLKTILKLDNDIYFIGNQAGTHKEECFLNADGFILPSLSEGMPMAVLEAWSYGLPSLITPNCNLPEGIEHNAAILMGETVEDTLIGLNQFFTTPAEQLAEISKNAVKLIKDKFTWDAVSQQYADVYFWMVNGGTPPDTVKFD